MRWRKSLTFLPLLALVLASCTRDPKVQAQRYLDNGNKFFAKGKYKEASIMYRRALQKNLRYGEAYYRLGLTDLKLAAYGDAANMLIRAVELQSDNTDATTKLADLYLMASVQDKQNSAKLTQNVQDLAAKLLAQDPNSYDGHRLMGQLAGLRMDFAAAVKEFGAANQIKPFQPDLVLSYVQALANNNQFQEAEKLGRDLINREKTYAPIYDLLYYHYSRLKRFEDGEQILKLKTQNNPQSSSYLIQLAAHYYLVNRRADMENVISELNREKEHPDGRLLAGDFFFFRLREFDRAQQEYEGAVKAFPKDKALYQKRLVELFASTNKNNEANQLLTSILKDNAKDTDAIAMRAALMLSTGNREQINLAVNDLQSLVAKLPQNHVLRYNYARALLAKGDSEQARLQLEEAIKLRPDFLAARQGLARLYLARADYGRALKAAEETIAMDPNNLAAHLVRSGALLGLSDQGKAREELEYITKNYPQNRDARYEVGYLAWQQKDYKKAEQMFGELYKTDPKDPRGLVGLTETLASQNRMGDAVKESEKAVQAEPDRRDLKLFLANFYVRAEKYDDAIKLFQGLVAAEPGSADLLYRLGETYRRKGDLNTAADMFRRSSQAAPNDTNPLMMLGLILEGTDRRAQAEPIWEQILKLQPDHPLALNNLAFIKAEEGTDLDTALSMAQKARQKVPNSPEIADTLGWIYIKKNLSEEAIRIFRDLVQQQPNNYQFHYHFGLALMQKGDKPSARRELQTAMKDNPSKADAAKIQDALAKL